METDDVHSFLLFGDSGTGKTTLWSSILEIIKGKVLVVLCSGGQRPGELKSIDPKHKSRIDAVTLESPDELNDIVGHIEDQGKNGEYGAAILDHVSGFQDLTLMKYKGLSEMPQQKTFGIATQQDWGEITGQIKQHLVKFLSLPIHRVVIAQQRTFQPKEETAQYSDIITPKIGSALTPGLAGWLHPACDYNIQTFIRPKLKKTTRTVAGKSVETTERSGGVEFCARTGRHDIFMTKFRVPLGRELPDDIVNPTFAQIMKIIKGE